MKCVAGLEQFLLREPNLFSSSHSRGKKWRWFHFVFEWPYVIILKILVSCYDDGAFHQNNICRHLSLPAARLNSHFCCLLICCLLLNFRFFFNLFQLLSWMDGIKKIAPTKDSTTHSRPTSSCDTTAAATTSHRESSRALAKSISPGSRSTINSVKWNSAAGLTTVSWWVQ